MSFGSLSRSTRKGISSSTGERCPYGRTLPRLTSSLFEHPDSSLDADANTKGLLQYEAPPTPLDQRHRDRIRDLLRKREPFPHPNLIEEQVNRLRVRKTEALQDHFRLGLETCVCPGMDHGGPRHRVVRDAFGLAAITPPPPPAR